MSIAELRPPAIGSCGAKPASWSYSKAFSRNKGLISAEEQERLRHSHVAIAGMGGVGGVHLVTLARLGVGKFTIADPDTFEVGNFNRQYGASTRTLGQSKAEVMAAEARAINPQVEIEVYREAVTPQNATEFLAGCDLFIDGIDFFAIQARRLLFQTARELGMWALTAGPIGFSTAWLSFDPEGMSFDRYFDMQAEMSRLDQLVAFAIGLSPRATQCAYFDLSQVDLESHTGPSVSLACQLASGVAAAEALKILLGRGATRPAPYYSQFDAYRGILRRGRLRGGNRHPLQRLKRYLLARYLRRNLKSLGEFAEGEA